jgi:hypothetical protein
MFSKIKRWILLRKYDFFFVLSCWILWSFISDLLKQEESLDNWYGLRPILALIFALIYFPLYIYSKITNKDLLGEQSFKNSLAEDQLKKAKEHDEEIEKSEKSNG